MGTGLLPWVPLADKVFALGLTWYLILMFVGVWLYTRRNHGKIDITS